MALSDEQIIDLFNEACREKFNGLERFRHFARAIEVEVRKDYDALILQLVEALEKADKISGYPNNRKTITAGRARLEGKP